jgi:hypothetical protein
MDLEHTSDVSSETQREIDRIRNNNYKVEPMLIESKSSSDDYFRLLEEEYNLGTGHQCMCVSVGHCATHHCECFLVPGKCTAECCPGCLAHSLKHRSELVLTKAPPPLFMASGREPRRKGCTCKKTKCYKHYCDCLKQNEYCGPFCSCVGCLNLPEAMAEPPTEPDSSDSPADNPYEFEPFRAPN